MSSGARACAYLRRYGNCAALSTGRVKQGQQVMPDISVNITALDPPNSSNQRPSGTFQKGTPWPQSWGSLNESGDIDVTGAPGKGNPQDPSYGVSISFTIADGLLGTDGQQLQFGHDGFQPPSGNNDFAVTSPGSGQRSQTMTVSDANAENRFTQLEYGLKFSDGTTLDPRMINR
jgi:hypothetical protein